MDEIGIDKALDQLEGPAGKTRRKDALQDIQHILHANRRNKKLRDIKDSGYQAIFHSIFQLVKNEKTNYAKPSKVQRDNASRVLIDCAATVRSTTEICIRFFGRKTVTTVISHIIEVLPETGSRYCEPLVGDYVKTLRTMLEYQSHIAHINSDLWYIAVEFCSGTLQAYVEDLDSTGNEHTITASFRSQRETGRRSRSSTPSISSSIAPSKLSFAVVTSGGPSSKSRQLAEEGTYCLFHLLSVPHAPILDSAQDNITSILEYLRSLSPLERLQGQEYSFRCLNCILSLLITENIELATHIVKSLIPQVRRLWKSKFHSSLKEEMLATFVIGERLLRRLLQQDGSTDTELELRGLVEVLQNDHKERGEKESLHYTDIEFGDPTDFNPTDALSYPGFKLKLGSPRAEQAWTLLRTVAVILSLFIEPDTRERHADSDDDVQNGRSNKRRKLDHPFNPFFEAIAKSNGTECVSNLQLLFFIVAETKIDADTTRRVLDCAVPMISAHDVDASNWAMLTLSGVALSQTQTSASPVWLQAWDLASRRVNNSTTSGPACHLMNSLLCTGLVQASSVKETIDPMLASLELSAPAAATDSALHMFRIVLQLKAKHNPSAVPDASEKIVRTKLTSLANISHRPSESRNFQAPNMENILLLIGTALGLRWQNFQSDEVRGGRRIAVAALSVSQNKELIEYLLLQQNSFRGENYLYTSSQTRSIVTDLADSQFKRLYNLVIESLQVELDAVLGVDGTSSVSHRHLSHPDAVAMITSLCAISLVLASSGPPNSSKPAILCKKAESVRDHLSEQLTFVDRPEEATRGLYDTLGPLLKCHVTNSSQENWPIHVGLHLASRVFGPKFWNRINLKENNNLASTDLMDVDSEFDSQKSQGLVNDDAVFQLDHQHSYFSSHTRRTTHTMRIILASFRLDLTHDSTPDILLTIPPEFVGFLTEKQSEDTDGLSQDALSQSYSFLMGRVFLNELLGSDLSLQIDSVVELFDYIGDKIVGNYEFERSEVGLGVCLEIMTHLVALWTNSGNDSMGEVSSQLYEWLIETVLAKQDLSHHVHACMAKMLLKVIQSMPDYGKSLSLPYPRTSLFQILDQGIVRVKYEVGLHLSTVFGLFILKEHDAILDDIVQHLPMERNRIEGTAVRLAVLSQLASSWSTLIRRCIYAVVEAPGLIPSAADHSRYCISELAKKLDVQGPKALFKLFAPQIIYTWLETQSLRTLPFRVFDYRSLKELLEDIKPEMTAQVIMRGRESEAQELSDTFGQPFKSLLLDAFGRSAAYVIAHDAAVSPSTDPQAAGGVKRLRNQTGKDQYVDLLFQHFPEILATFFVVADREDSIIKGFQKSESHTLAQVAYDEIISSGASESNIMMSQQPSFRASCLVEEINYICERTPIDKENMWTPALYTFVFRELMKSMHPALGSLHNVTVIRRIRILISMAGSHALHSYPLEMSLHSLRPFLIDTHCAEDVMGIFKYLVSKGSDYLVENPSFFAGIVLTALVSLRTFLATPQESTTQESEYLKTMSKAQKFKDWLGSFAGGCQFAQDDLNTEAHFRALIGPARKISGDGNAKVGSGESEMLLALLADQKSRGGLVEPPLRNLVIQALTKTFQVPALPFEDILGSDEQAARYASAVWMDFNGKQHSQQFGLWVARVLGRAYAGYGYVTPYIVQELSPAAPIPPSISASKYLTSESMFSIVRALRDVLVSGNVWEAGLVERALQSIISQSSKDESLNECVEELPDSLTLAFRWDSLGGPVNVSNMLHEFKLTDSLIANLDTKTLGQWAERLCLALIGQSKPETVLWELVPVICAVKELSAQLLPFVIHLILLYDYNRKQHIRDQLSKGLKLIFESVDLAGKQVVRKMIDVILYLRSQPTPQETTISDRFRWIDIDYQLAAEAATKCGMFKTALMFLETTVSENMKVKTSRRSSGVKTDLPITLLMLIYQNLGDKDFFYGIRMPSSLSSMMQQLEFEGAGFKSLSFRGAQYDSQIRQLGAANAESEEGIIKLLSNLDLNGISQSLYTELTNNNTKSMDAMYETARKLERWDIVAPSYSNTQATVVFKTFQELNDASALDAVRMSLDSGYSRALKMLTDGHLTEVSVHAALGTLAVLTEMEDVLTTSSADQLRDIWTKFQLRDVWMRNESLEKSNPIISCRRTLTSTLSKNIQLQSLLRVSEKESRVLEAKALLGSAALGRHHGSLQSSLDAATYLSTLVGPCKELGINIDASAQFEVSSVLWDQAEMAASIRMIREIARSTDLRSQAIPVGRPELLAKLGHRISEARLEKPDEIIEKYLEPAKGDIQQGAKSDEAGQVYHEFASFCDRQLQNQDNIEDLRRIRMLRERKLAEVQDLEKMMKAAASQSREREQLKSHRTKAKLWYDLDNAEYERLNKSRQALLNQSLENYLLCLHACDKYDNDVLRFSALWLEHSENEEANTSVAQYMAHVPSRKFAGLMNQWTSRLLASKTQFHKTLSELVLRICQDHPFHGMYHIFASHKAKIGEDQTSRSRKEAVLSIVGTLKNQKRTGTTWIAVHNTNIDYVRFAGEKSEDRSFKQGAKIPLHKSQYGKKLESNVKSFQVPPPTMKIELRPDCNYSQLPSIARFQNEFSIASGISMPKVLTAIGTDGQKYKQLFKSGNDDLRQDAIMEQVFEQVSNLLKDQRDTRQRNLGIRTYKVLPLTSTAGVIEWVQNTLPLNEFLMPAHPKHFPSDMKSAACRKAIHEAQSKGTEQRIKTYRQVCDGFHPVLRYFFMERFQAPDAWFASLLAYTRSTAAISMLGHILGIGDRHGHNILLDEVTGEVVHIDLGIAFEQGRVLPVPELVPFRLTRDVVDGMGVTKTEGVFRRSCEFTLEALRNESYSIMTILDVLRYDPLYSWSISPLRLRKLQDDQAESNAIGPHVTANGDPSKEKSEESEAERALTVVSKKLSKTLSVVATVNELIQQATDERNLALLFCGWAAYA